VVTNLLGKFKERSYWAVTTLQAIEERERVIRADIIMHENEEKLSVNINSNRFSHLFFGWHLHFEH
jgi:hypothetical protein